SSLICFLAGGQDINCFQIVLIVFYFQDVWLAKCYNDGDSFFPRKSHSMPDFESIASRSSTRRLRSRCHRPTFASIADSFVHSLVLASFCREHSPRSKSFIPPFKLPCSHYQPNSRFKPIDNPEKSLRRRRNFRRVSAGPISERWVKTSRKYSTRATSDTDDNFGDYGQKRFSLEGNNNGKDNFGHRWPSDHAANQQAVRSRDDKIIKGLNSTMAREFPLAREISDNSHSRLAPSVPQISNPRPIYMPRPEKERYEAVSEFYTHALGESTKWKETIATVMKDSYHGSSSSSRPSNNDTSRDAIENPAVEQFLDALFDETKSNQYIFRLYRELPPPGVALLSKRSRGLLLRRFANPPDRRWVDTRRYLALIEDMNTVGFSISRSLWTSAIHLAGRATGRIFKSDLKRAIDLWHRMEHFAGIRADSVVFSALFDIAVKAGQYMVADRLVEVMKDRNIDFSRCGKVSKIFYSGLQKDIGGIRKAFNEFVQSGEIVDTVVLNCLIVAFLRTGELRTAEQLYERMLEAQRELENNFPDGRQNIFHHPKLSSDISVYRLGNRKLNRILEMSAVLKNRFPEQYQALQSALPLTPDTRTFYIFLSHHALQTGDINKFMAVLKDMEKIISVPPRAMVYLLLFEGFALHGCRNRHWTAQRLQTTWKSFLRVLYESKEQFNNRFYFRRQKLGWENPLAKGREDKVEATPDDIYMRLPSDNPLKENTIDAEERKKEADEEVEDQETEELDEEDTDECVETLFANDNGSPGTSPRNELLDDIEHRIENGVFLGRKIIIAILRAFGTCCEDKQILDIWFQIERIWQIKKRKSTDVAAVKAELERQLSRKWKSS
ncbi:hypothetical protein Egran_06682, partial [Elaphomyces granulatus]